MAGFADSYALAADKCKATVKSVSLRVLARVLLDADSLAVDSAVDRATAAYKILEHLAQGIKFFLVFLSILLKGSLAIFRCG